MYNSWHSRSLACAHRAGVHWEWVITDAEGPGCMHLRTAHHENMLGVHVGRGSCEELLLEFTLCQMLTKPQLTPGKAGTNQDSHVSACGMTSNRQMHLLMQNGNRHFLTLWMTTKSRCRLTGR